MTACAGTVTDVCLYEGLGPGYDKTRRADPTIAARLYEFLDLRPGQTCLDIACGTGNYAIALSRLGLAVSGVDASPSMIRQAQSKAPRLSWRIADATSLPFPDRSQAGAILVLALHHMADVLPDVFAEAYRVLDGGRFCIFTADPAQIRSYWLRRYFPDLIERSATEMPDVRTVTDLLRAAGFPRVATAPYQVAPDVADLFLYAGKHRPWLYLRPDVRAGISSFAKSDPRELEAGIAHLREDIANGNMAEAFAQAPGSPYPGDYTFVLARKTS